MSTLFPEDRFELYTGLVVVQRDAADLARLRAEVFHLKKRLNAVVVAHNYQVAEVQDIADFVGDSLELARRCAEVKAETIVFCGVDFMAETAAILNPYSTVLLAVATACCPMAEMIDEVKLAEWKSKYPQAAVVAYVNTSAAVKAGSDICCTSSNAVKIVNSVENEEVLFLPDKNLGHFASMQTKKRMIMYPGHCVTHSRLQAEEVTQARAEHPNAQVLVHPECRPEVVALADAALSTSGILRYARESSAIEFLIGTEEGIMHRLSLESPQKRFYLISPSLICPNMKKTRLENVIETMQTGRNHIIVADDIRFRAKRALDRMLAVS